MKIGILGGTGRMGCGLADSYARRGHEVFLGSRSPDQARAVALGIEGEVRGGSLLETARDSDLLVVAVPFEVAEEMIRSLADLLRDKIVVDITNPFGAITPGRIAAVEVHANAVPSAHWVAAYKTTFWKTLGQPADSAGVTRDVLVCSDDRPAGQTVMDLIASTGFRPIDCGSLENARAVDLMVPLMLELDERYQCECASGWKFLTAP